MLNFTGALDDNRSSEDKDKDYSILELGAGTIPFKWTTKAKALKQAKEARNQGSTSSCGGHAGELAMACLQNNKYSPAQLYRHRANFPSEGMYIYDIGNIVTKVGVDLLEQPPTPTKEQIYNALPLSYKWVLKAGAFTVDSTPTIDELAYVSNALKCPQVIMIWSKDSSEYGSIIPVVNKTGNIYTAKIRHFVTILPNSAYIFGGKKYVVIQDSAHFGDKYIRSFSEEWIKERAIASMAVTGKLEYTTSNQVTYKWTRDLTVGDTGEDVKKLQEALKALGFFPSNIPCTEYFGGITRQAVKDFQKKYEKSILWPLGLKLPTGYFGKKTREQLIYIR